MSKNSDMPNEAEWVEERAFQRMQESPGLSLSDAQEEAVNEWDRLYGVPESEVFARYATDVSGAYNTLVSQNELIDLIRELAPEDPINQDEQGGCVWCNGPTNSAYGYATADPQDHTDECPWARARALIQHLDGASDA